MRTVLLCVAALVAGALGAAVEDSAPFQRQPLDTSYTVQILRGWSDVGSGALITDRHVVCAASIFKGTPVAAFSVRVGTRFSFPFNPFGQTVEVAHVAIHPDADVAVIVLHEPVTVKSVRAVAQPSAAAVPGSRAVRSGFQLLKLHSAESWLVLPKYCGAEAVLCATGGQLVDDGVLVVDGQLVGLALAPKKAGGLSAYTDLTEASVLQFIADAVREDAPTTTQQPQPAPQSNTCRVAVDGTQQSLAPLVVHADQPRLLHAADAKDAAVILQAGERIRLVCSGEDNHFLTDESRRDVVTAQCVGGDAFLVDGARVELHRLVCKGHASGQATARRSGTCGDQDQFTRIQIGFKVRGDFVATIDNCFDSRRFDAVYSRSTMTPSIAHSASGVKRPSFQPGTFYEGLNPNGLYGRSQQQAAFGKLLGDAQLGTKYVRNGGGNYFLTRGHLSAKADHVEASGQKATFFYVNAAPQWQTFNGDNWEKLESSVRRWVASSGRTVEIVTGIWGTATLPNKDGVETELYLEANKKYLRVPKYYWKVVYDPATKEGVAFVGVNNPYQQLSQLEALCEDQCSRYTWVSWDRNDQQSGFGFCCDVSELRKTVTTIPADIEVQGLI